MSLGGGSLGDRPLGDQGASSALIVVGPWFTHPQTPTSNASVGSWWQEGHTSTLSGTMWWQHGHAAGPVSTAMWWSV
jgi:hypothetical protein